MYGSIFYNCWGALIGFTLALLLQISEPFAMPMPTILTSLLWAAIAFGIMFGVRFFLGYVLYTPEELTYDPLDEDALQALQDLQSISSQESSALQFAETNNEEVAQVVRTMLNKEE